MSMIICKICEKDTHIDQLIEHSVKCKEIANLKEEIFKIRAKMELHIERASLIKNSLQTEVAKQQRCCSSRIGLGDSTPPRSFATEAMMKHEETLATKKTTSNTTTSIKDCDAEEGLSTSRTIESTSEVDGRKEYKRIAKEAKRSILALNKIIKVAKQICSWAYDALTAHEVNFNTKNEIEFIYEKIIDIKVSEFLKDFLIDLSVDSTYMNLKMEYLKKIGDPLVIHTHNSRLQQSALKKILRTQTSSFDAQKPPVLISRYNIELLLKIR